METKIAVVAIIVEDTQAVGAVNGLLHEYRDHIIGRQGIPYKQRGVSVISVVLDAPADAVNSLTGRLGMINGVAAKALIGKK